MGGKSGAGIREKLEFRECDMNLIKQIICMFNILKLFID